MNSIALSLVIAVTVEGIMEYLKTLVMSFQNKKYKKLVYYTSSLLLSILLCFLGQIDLYSTLAIKFSPAWLGILLTGIFASRGTNYMGAFTSQIENVRDE